MNNKKKVPKKVSGIIFLEEALRLKAQEDAKTLIAIRNYVVM